MIFFKFFILLSLLSSCASVSGHKSTRAKMMDADQVSVATAIDLSNTSFIRGCQEGLKLAGQHPSLKLCQTPFAKYQQELRQILEGKKY